MNAKANNTTNIKDIKEDTSIKNDVKKVVESDVKKDLKDTSQRKKTTAKKVTNVDEVNALKAELEAVRNELELLKNKDKTVRFNTTVDVITYDKLKRNAKNEDKSISKYVRDLLVAHLK